MPAIRLPIFDQSLFQKPVGDQVRSLADMLMRYKRELEFLLNGALDEENGIAGTIITNTLITNNLYAKEGRIARLTVNHLLTEDILLGAAHMYYLDAQDQYLRLIQADRRDDLPQVQYTDEEGTPLYWKDAEHSEILWTETAWPVMVYQYDKLIKREIGFFEQDGITIPMDVYGVGVGSEAHPERGKGFVVKDALGMLFKYIKADGTEVWMRLGENGAEGSLGKDVEVTAIEFNTEGMDVTYADEQVHNWDFVTNGAGRIIRLDNISTNRSITISYSGV